MKKLLYLTLIIVLVIVSTMIISGCITEEIPKPDLLPVNPNDMVNFCEADKYGNLLVHIKNQGTVTADASTLEVDFGQCGQVFLPVPSLLAGETTTILVPFCYGCFDPDCGFEIIVDSEGIIDESDETNNSQIGLCIG